MRTGSEGSLPAYTAGAMGENFDCRAGLPGRIQQGTFTRVAPPTIVEMEDLGSDRSDVQPPPPGEETVLLPPPAV